MQCLLLSGSDERMDCRNMDAFQVNHLPVLCTYCGFSDLEHVPQPYYLIKSKTLVPKEIDLAQGGNFLVRERVRRIVELAAPGQCRFFPTSFLGSSQVTPWLLAVPQHQVATANVDPTVQRCNKCGEPKEVHPGTHYKEILFGRHWYFGEPAASWTNDSEYDVLKSSTWYSFEAQIQREFGRETYFSVRLFHLLKQAKTAGLVEAGVFRRDPASPPHQKRLLEEKPLAPKAWMKEMLSRITAVGISLHPEGTLSKADTQWFKNYVDRKSLKKSKEYDIKAVEKELKVKLPRSYVEFITRVGPATFKNVDDPEEGFSAKLLPPGKLNELDPEMLEEESKAIQGLVFAETDFGDVFCFDIKKGQKEYAVYRLNHEIFVLEPYAENFAQCIKRFTGE